MMIHTGNKPYTCTVCDKRFTGKGNMTQHMIIHTGDKPYVCTLYEKAFARKGDLQQHMIKRLVINAKDVDTKTNCLHIKVV